MITIEAIRKLVEIYFNVDLRDTSRKNPMPSARYCYYNLCKMYTKKSLSAMSGLLNQDHCTALHYIQKYKLKDNDSKYLEDLCNRVDAIVKSDEPIEKIEGNEVLLKRLTNARLKIKELESEIRTKEESLNIKIDKRLNLLFKGNQKRLNIIFMQLPPRIQEDLLFKAEVALKLNAA